MSRMLKMDSSLPKCDGDVPPISKILALIRIIRRAINNKQLILRTSCVNTSLLSLITLKIPRNTLFCSHPGFLYREGRDEKLQG
jgi:hypothetical protein